MPLAAENDGLARNVALARALPWLVFLLALGRFGGYAREVLNCPGSGYSYFNIVQGSPYSDARDWKSMGEDFAAGRRVQIWKGRRLLYPLFLGAWFVTLTPRYAVGVATSVVCLAACALWIYRAGCSLYGAAAGLCGVAWLLFDPEAACLGSTTMTEPLGLVFLTWHFAELCRGFEQRDPLRLAWSGALLGLSNAARSLTLFALPGMALLLAFWLWRGRAGWRNVVACSAALVAGAAAVIVAFMGLNYAVNGIFSLSDNTLGDLYAVTSPRFKRWSPEVQDYVGQQTRESAIDQEAFYRREIRQNLRQHPEVFAGRVLANFWAAGRTVAEHLRARPAFWLAPLLVGCAAATWPRRLAWWGLGIAGMLAWHVWATPAWAGALMAAALAWALLGRPRPMASVLAWLVVCTLFSIGLFGTVQLGRLYFMIEWACVLAVSGMVTQALSWGAREAGALDRRLADAASAAFPLARWVGVVTLLVWLCGLAVLAQRNVWSPPPPPIMGTPRHEAVEALLRAASEGAPERLRPEERASLKARSQLRIPFNEALLTEADGQLHVALGCVEDLPAYFPAGSRPALEVAPYAPRSIPFTRLLLKSGNTDGSWGALEVAWTGDARRLARLECAMLGRVRVTSRGAFLEAMACCPWNFAAGTFDLDRIEVVDDTAESRQLLADLARKYEGAARAPQAPPPRPPH